MSILDDDESRLARDHDVRLQTENSVLLSMAKSIASIRDKVDLLKVILGSVMPLFDADDVGLGILNEEANTLTDWAVVFPSVADSAVNNALNTNQDTTLSLTNSLIEKTIREVEEAGHPLLIDLTESLAQQWPEATYLPVEIAHGFKQSLFTTLKVGNKLIGTFNLNGRNDRHFDSCNLDLFQSIADLLAVAVANILANEEILKREREKSLLLEISKSITRNDTIVGLLRNIDELLIPIFQYETAGLEVVNKELTEFTDYYSYYNHQIPSTTVGEKLNQLQDELGMTSMPLAGSLIEYFMAQPPSKGKLADVLHLGLDAPYIEFELDNGLVYFICAPLIVSGKRFGLFNLLFSHQHPPTEEMLPFFAQITDIIAVALANLLANVEILEREREKSLLLSLSEAVATVRSKEDVLRLIIQKVKPLFNFYDCGILIVDQKNQYHDLAVLHPTIDESDVNFSLKGKGFYQHEGLAFRDSGVEWLINQIDAAESPIVFDFTADHSSFSDYVLLEELRNLGYKEAVAGTLKAGGKVFGCFTINYTEPGLAKRVQIPLFQNVVDQLSSAVANILANEEILEREREKAKLLEISEAIAQVKSTDNLLKLIINKIKPLFQFHDCGLFIVNSTTQTHTDLAAVIPDVSPSDWNEKIALVSANIPHPNSPIEWMMAKIDQTRGPVLFDFQELAKMFPDYPQINGTGLIEMGYRDCLATNLKVRGQSIGLFCINALKKDFFSPAQFSFFQSVANGVSVAVANSLANEEILEREREKTTLQAITASLSRVRTRQELMGLINEQVRPLFNCHEKTDILLLSPDGEWLDYFYNPGLRDIQVDSVQRVFFPRIPCRGIMKSIFTEGKEKIRDMAYFREQAARNKANEPVARLLQQLGIEQAMVGQLRSRGKIIGSLHVHSSVAGGFHEGMLPLFNAITDQIAVAVDNILANEDVLNREREKSLQLAILQLINQLPTISSHDAQLRTLLQVAQEIDQLIPFDMLVSNTFFNNLHFLSSCFEISKQAGVFQPLPERESFRSRQSLQLHQLTETQPPMAELFRRPGVYVGQAFADICANYPNPKLARDTYGIESVMYIPLRIFNKEAGTIILASRQPMAFTSHQLHLLEELFAQLGMAIENILVCEDLNQREQEKSLQLALNNTLVNLKAPDQLSQTLASEVSRIVPFEGFNLRINRQQQLSYHTYLYRDETGTFCETLPYLLVQSQFKLMDMEQQLPATNCQSGLYDGESFRQFCSRHDLYQFVSQQYAFQSLLVFYLPLAQGNWASLALWSTQPSAFKTYHFDLLSGLLPQVSLALENLLSFDDLHRRDEQKATQLAISNVLLSQQQQPRILPDIAAVLNQSLSCDFCCVLASPEANALQALGWGAVNANGQFVSLARSEFLKQAGLTDQDYDQHVQANVPELAMAQLFVGEPFDDLTEMYPLAAALSRQIGIKSLICQPLTVQGVHSITLIIGSRRAYALTPGDLETTHEVALQMALALENRLAFTEIERLKGQLEQENVYLQNELKISYNFEEIVGESPALSHVFEQVRMVSPTDSTVLIEGETGTGKELIARAIHNYSPRRTGILVKVNCAALPANLIESELFGHEKGAFTGALERRIGKFELATGGTLFLDEIGELPLELQAKLLRAIQEREIERVGGKSTIRIDVRIVAATNKNLAQESKSGQFRTDLYYRLNVFPILLPPLRQRRDDIPLLATHFARKFSRKMGKKIVGLSPLALQQLMAYEFPGNIRELEHIIEHAVILSQGNRLELGRPLTNAESVITTAGETGFVIKTLQHHERDYILQVLKYTGGRIRGTGGAAELMGIHPNTLESRMQKLGIHKAFVM